MHWFSVTHLEQNTWHKTNQQQKKLRRDGKTSLVKCAKDSNSSTLLCRGKSLKKFQNDNRLHLSQQNFKHLATIRTTTQ